MRRTPTPNQKKAIETFSANLSVHAGAGTGKTFVLVERFVEIIRKKLARPNEILAITFTEKAANEMKARIVDLLKKEGLNEARREIENAYIGTIHAFSARLLKEHPLEAGIDPNFRVVEEDEANLFQELASRQVIEHHFEEPDVFELLHRYSERAVRAGVKEIYEKIRVSGHTIENAVKIESKVSPGKFKKEVLNALDSLSRFDSKKESAEKIKKFLENGAAFDGWIYIETLKQFSKEFTLRGKGKEEVSVFRDVFSRFLQCHIEILAEPAKKTFLKLLEDFAGRYQNLKNENACFDFSDLQSIALKLLSSNAPASESIRERYQRQFKFIMVDEFQDTDPLQVELISKIHSGNNLFLVGDSKQSIYGFRGTDPAIFETVSKQFEKISLTQNYRSREEIIHYINQFFCDAWSSNPDLLISAVAASKPPEPAIEVLEIEGEKGELAERLRIREARVLASRVRELVENQNYDYGDFAVLFRAGTSLHIYEQALRDLQIPYYSIGGRGFYEQHEIKDVLNFLTILENPFHDIALAALLRSPLFQVSDDGLFWLSRKIKANDPKSPFFDSLKNIDEIPELNDRDRQRVIQFKIIYEELLMNRHLSVSKTIERILEKTKYDIYILGLHQGKRHLANLRKLIELARELEIRDTVHLGDFVRYVKGLQIQEVRESEAQVEAAEGNVVKLLTIHRAKGLEFKVVVLPDLLRGRDPKKGCFTFDAQNGIGIKAFNPETSDFDAGYSFQMNRNLTNIRELEEEKRLLYVAMTRAKDRLIFSGARKAKKKEKEEEEDEDDLMTRIRRVIEKNQLESVRLSPERYQLKKGRKRRAIAELKGIREKLKAGEAIRLKENPALVSQVMKRAARIPALQFERIDLPVSAYLAFQHDHNHEEFKRVYELGTLPKLEIKPEELLAGETEETGMLSAADFGTLIHKILEHLVARKKEDSAHLQNLLQFYTGSLNSKNQGEAKRLVTQFLSSKIYGEIRRALRIIPELPFVLRLKKGIVQGTIDLFCETEKNKFVIFDYKTSQIEKPQVRETGENYRTQMELYALACREILGTAPQKAVLCFLRPNETYEISFEKTNFDRLKQNYEDLQENIIQYSTKLRKELP